MSGTSCPELPPLLDTNHRTFVQIAIREELRAATKALVFVVERTHWNGGLLTIGVNPLESKSGLKESLEECPASWSEPEHGYGEVLLVDTEKAEVHLRRHSGSAPAIGTRLFVTPPPFLESLQTIWYDNDWFERMRQWYNNSLAEPEFILGRGLNVISTMPLRERQRLAFQLPAWSASFLWGPPGTGKTYTIGAILAQFLRQHHKSRVLLVSSTNVAVDQALVSVDDSYFGRLPRPRPIRPDASPCVRIGTNFKATLYKDRGHLLPKQDDALVAELAALETSRPDSKDATAFALWKSKVDAVRGKMRTVFSELVDKHRLIAMTATSACYHMDVLRAAKPFDFVLFDEASQLGAAHALALAPLGRTAAFAGDPQQLAPITISDTERSRQWLGRSMFDKMDGERANSVLLDEQSRMRPEICAVVSKAFYRDRLRVAEDCGRRPDWLTRRQPTSISTCGSSAAIALPATTDGAFNPYYKGPCRRETAEIVAALVEELLNGGLDPSDIAVLTPYHAQRAVIRHELSKRNVRKVTVSTVHSVQGSERHTVIFDPVQGEDPFFRNEMGGDRLINVAISRAMARLVLVLSPGDRRNPTIGRIASLLDRPTRCVSAPTVHKWIEDPEYPRCLVGQLVQVPGLVGGVSEVYHGDHGEWMLAVYDSDRAEHRRFRLSVIEERTKPTATGVPMDTPPMTTSSSMPESGSTGSARARSRSHLNVVLRPIVVRIDRQI